MRGGARMRLRVWPERCAGHGSCFMVDSDLFPLNEDGLTAVEDGVEVPEGLEGAAREGVDSCPVLALGVESE